MYWYAFNNQFSSQRRRVALANFKGAENKYTAYIWYFHYADILYMLLFSCSVGSDSLRPHELQHTRLPYPSPSPRVCSNSCPKLKLMNLLRVCSNSCLNSEGEVVVPEVCGQSSCQTHGADRKKHFPSFFLVSLGPFPPHSHCGLSQRE